MPEVRRRFSSQVAVSMRRTLTLLPGAVLLLLAFTLLGATPGVRASGLPVPMADSLGADSLDADSLDGPDAVAAAYLNAFRRTEWARCAELMHPDALQSLKDVLIEAVETGRGSGIPDALYGDNTPPETIRYAPPAELYARMLRVVYRRTEPAAQVLDGMSAEILGHVRESDRLVHVVARTRVASAPDTTGTTTRASSTRPALSQVEVLTLERHQSTWRLRLTTDIKNVARAVRE
jgi:hypothetical protein